MRVSKQVFSTFANEERASFVYFWGFRVVEVQNNFEYAFLFFAGQVENHENFLYFFIDLLL